MSFTVVGLTGLAACIIVFASVYAMVSDQDLHQPKAFQARKKLYRKQRDSFRNNHVAMEELENWRSENGECRYTELCVFYRSIEKAKPNGSLRDARNGKHRATMHLADLITILHRRGLIPENCVGKRRRDKIFAKCDTWFSVSPSLLRDDCHSVSRRNLRSSNHITTRLPF